MKKILFLAVAFLMVGSVAVFGQGLAGSAHDFIDDVSTDFADDSWNTSASNAMCGPCHVPHQAYAAVTDAPLWSHATTANAGSFTLYTGVDLQATMAQPSGVSLLCLSCHDGSALDAHKNTAAPSAVVFDALDVSYVGTDLGNDHPVSFTYNTALVGTGAGQDPELFDPAVAVSGLAGGGTISDDLLFGASNDQVECASCHDPHNNGEGITTESGLLRMVNTNSQLCLTCHDK